MNTIPGVCKIKTTWKSQPTIEGAGVHLRRAFGFHDLPLLDPFLLLDDFRSENPEGYKAGFPWHPHRGIETITYVLEGDVEHGDSLGNKGNISNGDVQWMTAGSGIIHQEMPKGDSKGKMLGFQLWANLPARSKMIDPQYRGLQSNQIPLLTLPDGTIIRIICGEINKVQGPLQGIISDPEFLDIAIPAGKTFVHPVKKGYKMIAYVIDGEAFFDPNRMAFAHDSKALRYCDLKPPCACHDHTLVLFDAGDAIHVTTVNHAVRFLLMSGKPIKEPIAWYGPIVMNTQEELSIAFQEYEEGTFVKQLINPD